MAGFTGWEYNGDTYASGTGNVYAASSVNVGSLISPGAILTASGTIALQGTPDLSAGDQLFLSGNWIVTNTTPVTSGSATGLSSIVTYDGQTASSTSVVVSNKLFAQTSAATTDTIQNLYGVEVLAFPQNATNVNGLSTGIFVNSSNATTGNIAEWGCVNVVFAGASQVGTVGTAAAIHIESPTGSSTITGTDKNVGLLIDNPIMGAFTNGTFSIYATGQMQINSNGDATTDIATFYDPTNVYNVVQIAQPLSGNAAVAITGDTNGQFVLNCTTNAGSASSFGTMYRFAGAGLGAGNGLQGAIFTMNPQASSGSPGSDYTALQSEMYVTPANGYVDPNNYTGTKSYVFAHGSGGAATVSGYVAGFGMYIVAGSPALADVIDNVYGFRSDFTVSSSSTVVNAAGLFVPSPGAVVANAGTIQHNYGIYIGDQTVAGTGQNYDPWAIYSPSNSRVIFGPADSTLPSSVQFEAASTSAVYRFASSGQAKPFSVASVTSVQITSNVVTLQAVNTFSVGQTVQVYGFTSATFLNAVVLVITAATGTQFSANFTHANYGPTAEGGAFAIAAEYSTAFSVQSAEDPSVGGQYTLSAMEAVLGISTASDLFVPAGDVPVVWPSGGVVGGNFTGNHEGAGRIYGQTPVQTVQVTSNVLTVVPQSGNRYSPWIIGTTLTFSGFTTATFLNPATITQTQVASNVLTVTCANSFANGQTILLKGLTTSTFLNWQVVTITTATGTNFTAPFTHANYGPTADTGSANPIATVTASSYSGGGASPITATFGTHADVGLTTDTTGVIVGGTFLTTSGAVITTAVNASTGGMDMVCGQVIDTGLQGHANNVCGTFYTQMSDQAGYADNQYAIYVQDQTQTARSRSGNVWAIYVQGGTSRFTGVATNIQTITTTYTATVNDYTLLCNGTFTVTLPTIGTLLSGANPQGVKVGQLFVIKNVGTGTITVSSTANIDGATTYTIGAQYQSITVQWDGTQYWII